LLYQFSSLSYYYFYYVDDDDDYYYYDYYYFYVLFLNMSNLANFEFVILQEKITYLDIKC